MICPFNVAPGLMTPGLTAPGYVGGGDVDGTAGVHGETFVGYGCTDVGKRTRCASEVFAMKQTLAITSNEYERFVRGGAEGQGDMLRPCYSLAERQTDRRGFNNLPDSMGQGRFAACNDSMFGTGCTAQRTIAIPFIRSAAKQTCRVARLVQHRLSHVARLRTRNSRFRRQHVQRACSKRRPCRRLPTDRRR